MTVKNVSSQTNQPWHSLRTFETTHKGIIFELLYILIKSTRLRFTFQFYLNSVRISGFYKPVSFLDLSRDFTSDEASFPIVRAWSGLPPTEDTVE